MKRLLSIVTALLIAALFLLPAAAIINLDGTEPEWDGDPGIRPAIATIDGMEPLEPASEAPADGEAVLYIGEPMDTLPDGQDAEDDLLEFDRSHLARSAEAQTELAALSGMNLVLYIGLGAVSLAALALSIVAIVKVRKK